MRFLVRVLESGAPPIGLLCGSQALDQPKGPRNKSNLRTAPTAYVDYACRQRRSQDFDSTLPTSLFCMREGPTRSCGAKEGGAAARVWTDGLRAEEGGPGAKAKGVGEEVNREALRAARDSSEPEMGKLG